MRDNKSRKITPSFTFMHVALLLLCAVLITSHITGGLYARYKSEVSSDDGARVIYFGDISITETGDEKVKDKYIIIPGMNINKKATVDFEGSESATYVFVEITVSANWQCTADGRRFFVARNGVSKELVSWTVGDDWVFLSNDGNSYVYYYKGDVLMPNTKVEKSDIIVDGTLNVSEEITSTDIAVGTFSDLSITFQASAVQSIGFADVNDAWASLSAQGGD